MKLNIGVGHGVIASDESPGLEVIRCRGSRAMEEPLITDFWFVPPLQRRVFTDRLLTCVLNIHFEVILEVLSDTGKVLHDWNTKGLKIIGDPHSGELKELRGVD